MTASADRSRTPAELLLWDRRLAAAVAELDVEELPGSDVDLDAAVVVELGRACTMKAGKPARRAGSNVCGNIGLSASARRRPL